MICHESLNCFPCDAIKNECKLIIKIEEALKMGMWLPEIKFKRLAYDVIRFKVNAFNSKRIHKGMDVKVGDVMYTVIGIKKRMVAARKKTK